jgi:hypothetical protein
VRHCEPLWASLSSSEAASDTCPPDLQDGSVVEADVYVWKDEFK